MAKSKNNVKTNQELETYEDFEPKSVKEFNRNFGMRKITPMNTRQSEYLEYLQDDDVPLVLCYGYAGTSKTFLAVYAALRKLKTGKIDTIAVMRPPVSDSPSLGFTKGSEWEKQVEWLLPVIDCILYLAGEETLNDMLECGVLKAISMEKLKGQSFRKSYVICDEAEDIRVKELIKFVTRQAEGSKMVLAGDILQVDIKKESGLEKAIYLADKYPDRLPWKVVGFDQKEHIVRHEAVKQAIIVFEEEGLL